MGHDGPELGRISCAILYRLNGIRLKYKTVPIVRYLHADSSCYILLSISVKTQHQTTAKGLSCLILASGPAENHVPLTQRVL